MAKILHSERSWMLEEQVPLNMKVVGRPEWFANEFDEHVEPAQRLVVEKQRDLDPVLQDLSDHAELGVDTETGGPYQGDPKKKIPADGLDPISSSSKIVLFQIGHPDLVYVVDPALIPHFGFILKDQKKVLILQNSVHDYKFLYQKNKIRMANMFDTMIAEQVLTAGSEGRKVGLADLARKYPPHRLITKAVREDFLVWPIRMNKRKIHYAARDVFLMFPIRAGQKALIVKHGMNKCMMDERKCLPVTAEMEMTGVYLDPGRMALILEYYERLQAQLENEIFLVYNQELKKRGTRHYVLVGEDEFERFNLSAPVDKVRALHRLGIDVSNVQKGTLNDIEHPIAALMVEWMECNKILSTYGKNLLDQVHRESGQLHPRFFQHGAGEMSQQDGKDVTVSTATGRYTSNFQQIPRPEKILEKVEDPAEIAAVLSVFGIAPILQAVA